MIINIYHVDINTISHSKYIYVVRSKLEINADDNPNVVQMTENIESIVGKGENVGYQHFLLFPRMLSNGFFLWVTKT